MIALVWLIFTVLFSLLAVFHWKLSRSSIKPAEIAGLDIRAQIAAQNEAMFPYGLNRFIETFNSTNRDQNRVQAFGYLLAALTALVSFFLALPIKFS